MMCVTHRRSLANRFGCLIASDSWFRFTHITCAATGSGATHSSECDQQTKFVRIQVAVFLVSVTDVPGGSPVSLRVCDGVHVTWNTSVEFLRQGYRIVCVPNRHSARHSGWNHIFGVVFLTQVCGGAVRDPTRCVRQLTSTSRFDENLECDQPVFIRMCMGGCCLVDGCILNTGSHKRSWQKVSR